MDSAVGMALGTVVSVEGRLALPTLLPEPFGHHEAVTARTVIHLPHDGLGAVFAQAGVLA